MSEAHTIQKNEGEEGMYWNVSGLYVTGPTLLTFQSVHQRNVDKCWSFWATIR